MKSLSEIKASINGIIARSKNRSMAGHPHRRDKLELKPLCTKMSLSGRR
jgi:hypothetical protein